MLCLQAPVQQAQVTEGPHALSSFSAMTGILAVFSAIKSNAFGGWQQRDLILGR